MMENCQIDVAEVFAAIAFLRSKRGPEFLDNIKPQERKKLGEELLKKGYRLGCQTFVTDGDIKISWDEEIKKQVVKRKLDKSKQKLLQQSNKCFSVINFSEWAKFKRFF